LLQVDQDGERVAGPHLRKQRDLDALGGLHLQVADHLQHLWISGITGVLEHGFDDLGWQAVEVSDELIETSHLVVGIDDIFARVRRVSLDGMRGGNRRQGMQWECVGSVSPKRCGSTL
jgi:hypothetical protein